MPHLRPRYLDPILKERLKFSPIVGVLGHRQTGKTTLIQSIAKEYASLDRAALLTQAQEHPETFLHDRKQPFAIDECQLAPELFPELKEQVRLNKRPGRFLLSGSVRFTSRKAIRESLTGRIVNLELLPMSLAELHERPLPDFLIQYLKRGSQFIQGLKPNFNLKQSQSEFTQYMNTGGLPGIAFTRKPEIYSDQLSTHLDTILQRDLNLIWRSRLDSTQLRRLLQELVRLQGRPINFSDLKRETRLATTTLKSALAAFEALFLIRILPTEGSVRASTLFFEDSGLANYLTKTPLSEDQKLTHGLFLNLRPQFHYRPQFQASAFAYKLHSGAHVPIAFHTTLGTLGVLPILDTRATKSATLCANSFHKAYPNSKFVIAHSGSDLEIISSHTISAPWPMLIL